MDPFSDRVAPLWHPSDMKAIRITLDVAVLERLDRLPSVRKRGRSAVLREAVEEFLNRWEAQEIARRYREGYRDATVLDHELDGWTDEGVWPPGGCSVLPRIIPEATVQVSGKAPRFIRRRKGAPPSRGSAPPETP